MPLTLIFGEAGTGKSTYAIEKMNALHNQGIKTLMIVPEQFAHSAETRLISKIGYLSDEIQATSFKRLAHKYLKKNGTLRGSISSIGKSMLFAKAVIKNQKNLSLYKSTAKKPGFVDAVLSFIAECKRSEISPDDLCISIPEQPLLSLKLQELSMLYSTYQELLASSYTDGDEAVSLFSQMIVRDGLFSNTCIFVDEFFRFTKAELSCLRAMLSSGASVFVTLGAASGQADGIYEPVSQTASALRQLAKETSSQIHEPIMLLDKHRFVASNELAHFEKEYAHHPPILYKEETHDITLYVAPNPYTETQVVATAIRRAVAQNNLRYRDIAILTGDPELYNDLIKTVFPVYDIPVFIDRKQSLLSHAVIVMFFSLFDLITRGIDTEALLTYMKCGYCGLTHEEIDKLENFALAGRLKRHDWLDDKRFLRQAKSIFNQEEDYEETNAEEAYLLLSIRNKMLAPLLNLRHNLAKSRLVSDRAAALFNFLEEIELKSQISMQIERHTEAKEHQQAKELSEIYNLLITLLNELVTCLGEEKIGLRRLTDILSSGLAQCETSIIPPTVDQVFLGDPHRSLTKNVKLLFVIGAVEGTFPSSATQDTLLKDSERSALENLSVHLGPGSKQITFHNQYVTYSALHISREKMHISYPVADMEGTGLRPSPLINRLRKIFPNLLSYDDLASFPPPQRIISGKQSAWQYVLEHFNETEPEIKSLKAYFSQDADYASAYQAALRFSKYKKQPGHLSPDIAHRLYGHHLRGSVTQFETYASCPFSYFLRYGLKAKERKILKIEAPDIGSLMHSLIELASQRIAKEKKHFGTLTEDYINQLASDLVEELFAGMFIKNMYGKNRLQALIKRLKRQTARLLSIISLHVAKGEFEPCDFEVAFDENGTFEPVSISLPNGDSVTLIGRIDRIDVMRQNAHVYIKIIDYKTGNKSFRLSDVYNGLSLQLAVYLIAATESEHYKKDGTPMPAGMFYFRLTDKSVNAGAKNAEEALFKQFKMSGLVLKDVDMIRAMDEGLEGYSSILPARISSKGQIIEKDGSYATLEQFSRLKRHVLDTVSQIGEEILRGKNDIYPEKSKEGLPCRYCKYHPVCNFDAEQDFHNIAPPLKDDVVWEEIGKKYIRTNENGGLL